MTKARTIWLAALAALASLALLIPASSAQAALTGVPYCGQLTSSGYAPITLKPGQMCGFWPVAVRQVVAYAEVTKPGNGAVCLEVVQYPPGWPNGTPLDPSGHPGGWDNCRPVQHILGGLGWRANNGFDAVYGQAVFLNYSTATIRTLPGSGFIQYYY